MCSLKKKILNEKNRQKYAEKTQEEYFAQINRKFLTSIYINQNPKLNKNDADSKSEDETLP